MKLKLRSKALRGPLSSRWAIVAGIIILAFGLFIGSSYFLNLLEVKNSGPFLTPAAQAAINQENLKGGPLVTGTPSTISIPSVNIDIPVDAGSYNALTKTWTLSLTDAEYAVNTPPPNNLGGNTFIYGHNRWAVFYKLLRITPGSLATVSTVNHHSFIYQLVSEKITNPNDTSIFTYHGNPILTLQTCSGSFYQNRQFFIFKLVSYS